MKQGSSFGSEQRVTSPGKGRWKVKEGQRLAGCSGQGTLGLRGTHIPWVACSVWGSVQRGVEEAGDLILFDFLYSIIGSTFFITKY